MHMAVAAVTVGSVHVIGTWAVAASSGNAVRSMVGNVRDTGGWHTPAVVVLVTHNRSEWHGHWHAITLSSVNLTIAWIAVVGVQRVNHLVTTERWATFASTAVGQEVSAHSVASAAVPAAIAVAAISEQAEQTNPSDQAQATAFFTVAIDDATTTGDTAAEAAVITTAVDAFGVSDLDDLSVVAWS